MRKNLLLSLISAASKVIGGLVLLALLARIFSLTQFGNFTYSLTLATLFSLLVDYGYNLKIIKDVSADPKEAGKITSTAFVGKFILFAITFVICLFSNGILNNSNEVYLTAFFLFLSLALFSFTNVILNVFKGKEEFDKDAVIVLIDNLLTVAAVVTVAYLTRDILWSAIAFSISKFVAFIIAFLIYLRKNSIQAPKFGEVLKDLSRTFPYAIHYWVGSVYLNVDTVIMKSMVTAEEIGIYQAGIRIVIGAGILLTIINSVFLPALNKMLVARRNDFGKGLVELNALTVKYSLIVSLLLILFGKWVVLLLYGNDFNELNSFLWIIALIIGIRIFGVTYGILLTISDKQKIRAIAGFLSIVLIIFADYLVIPRYGYISAAYVLLAAHLFINLFYLITVYKEHKTIFLPGIKMLFSFKLLP